MKNIKKSSFVFAAIAAAILSFPDFSYAAETKIFYTGEKEIFEGLRFIYELKLDKAEEVFKKMIKRYPESPAGLYYLTAVRSAPEESNRRWLRTARLYGITKPPKRPMKNLKEMIKSMNDIIGQCDSILKKNPRSFEALLYRAGAYAFNARVKLYNGRVISSMRDAKKAAKLFDKLLEDYPNEGDAMLGPGVYKYMVGKLPAPLRFITSLLGLSGTKKEGIILIEGAYEKGVLSSTEAANLLAWIYNLYERDDEKSLKWADALEEREPDSPLIDSYRLFVYNRRGEIEKEEETIISLMSKLQSARNEIRLDWTSLLTYALGIINEKKGHKEQAKELFQKALAMKDVDPWLKGEIRRSIKRTAKYAKNRKDYARRGSAAGIPEF